MKLHWLPHPTQIPVKFLGLGSLLFLGFVFVFLSSSSSSDLGVYHELEPRKYLYWGYRIDCPGKNCDACAGLGHQESSLRCALEEAMVLGRTFVMPSQMCLNKQHNDKALLYRSEKFEGWGIESCPMESLYDLSFISQIVRVVLDDSDEWKQALSTAHMSNSYLGVKNVSRSALKSSLKYQKAAIINRTASPLAWFVECPNRKNHSTLLLPYSFLPKMAAKPLRLAARKIIDQLGDYDAIHVRRGDVLKLRKDRFGVERTTFPHLDRDTQATAIMRRVAKWIPEGRTLFIASNERKPGFFDALGSKYRLVFISHFDTILEHVVQNNYQLFMIERLILYSAKTYVKTFKEFPGDLSLTDDKKKRSKSWVIPVYSFDEKQAPS